MAKDLPSTKPLLEKLGVKPGMRVVVVDVADDEFLQELGQRAEVVSQGRSPKLRGADRELDMVFLGVEGAEDVGRMGGLREAIRRDGAVWTVFRKGRKEFNENEVRRLGLETGLVDVKVVRFSETHTALKWVIRKAER